MTLYHKDSFSHGDLRVGDRIELKLKFGNVLEPKRKATVVRLGTKREPVLIVCDDASDDERVYGSTLRNNTKVLEIGRKLGLYDGALIIGLHQNDVVTNIISRADIKEEKPQVKSIKEDSKTETEEAKNTSTSIHILKYLSKNRDFLIRSYVAANTSTPIETLNELKNDKTLTVQKKVRTNPTYLAYKKVISRIEDKKEEVKPAEIKTTEISQTDFSSGDRVEVEIFTYGIHGISSPTIITAPATIVSSVNDRVYVHLDYEIKQHSYAILDRLQEKEKEDFEDAATQLGLDITKPHYRYLDSGTKVTRVIERAVDKINLKDPKAFTPGDRVELEITTDPVTGTKETKKATVVNNIDSMWYIYLDTPALNVPEHSFTFGRVENIEAMKRLGLDASKAHGYTLCKAPYKKLTKIISRTPKKVEKTKKQQLEEDLKIANKKLEEFIATQIKGARVTETTTKDFTSLAETYKKIMDATKPVMPTKEELKLLIQQDLKAFVGVSLSPQLIDDIVNDAIKLLSDPVKLKDSLRLTQIQLDNYADEIKDILEEEDARVFDELDKQLEEEKDMAKIMMKSLESGDKIELQVEKANGNIDVVQATVISPPGKKPSAKDPKQLDQECVVFLDKSIVATADTEKNNSSWVIKDPANKKIAEKLGLDVSKPNTWKANRDSTLITKIVARKNTTDPKLQSKDLHVGDVVAIDIGGDSGYTASREATILVVQGEKSSHPNIARLGLCALDKKYSGASGSSYSLNDFYLPDRVEHAKLLAALNKLGFTDSDKVLWYPHESQLNLHKLIKSANKITKTINKTTKEKTMSNESMTDKPSFLDMVKSDAKDAGYRVAATQMTAAVKGGILLFLKNKGTDGGKLEAMKEMLDSPIGDAAVELLLGFGLTYAPGIGEDPRIVKLAGEFRIGGMAVAGNLVAEMAMGFVLPAIQDAMKVLPPLETVKTETKARIAAPKEEIPVEEGEEEEETADKKMEA